MYGYTDIEYIYFENNPSATLINIKRRNRLRDKDIEPAEVFNYTIPSRVKPLKVWGS